MDNAGPPPLAGRRRELDSLDAALAAAARGRAGLVSIVGESGIGKTRLAQECAERAGELGFSVAWGAGWSDGGMPSDWPWHELLDQLGETKVAALLDTATPTRNNTQLERFAMYRTVAAAIARVAAGRPVLVVIDDAHAVDPGALQLARFVVRTLRMAPLCVVLTCRANDPTTADETADETADALAALLAEGARLEPAVLGGDDIAVLLRWAGRRAGPEEAAELLQLTGGNPLLIHELLSTATAVGDPRRVRRLLYTRLRPFGASHMASLAAAAVLGPSATLETVAAVAGIAAEDARLLRRVAADAGLLSSGDQRDFVFAHGMLRDALLNEVGDDHVAMLRQRAADVIEAMPGPFTAQRLNRLAGLRVAAAAHLGDGAIDRAVDAALEAARADRGQYGYESTAPLLRAACRMLDDDTRPVPHPLLLELLLQLGTAEYARGRLVDSRAAFRRITDSADAQVAPVLFAEAVLGIGGLSVFEHRTAAEIREFRALLARSIDALGAQRPDLRARLTARAAAEEWFAGTGSLSGVIAAVDAVRSADDVTVAESLSLLHHVLLGPEWGAERREIAEQLNDVAIRAGDGFQAVMGVMWKTVDQFLAGDSGAERSLTELRQRSDALQIRLVHYVAGLMDVMLLIRAGRLDEAEAESARSFERGVEVGEADASGYYAGHLLTLRWLQGRTDEIVDIARSVATAPTILAGDEVYRAAFAAVAAIVGGAEADAAQGALDRISQLSLDRIPTGSNWLVTMFTLVEAAAALGDASVAAAVYDLLKPHAGLAVMGSLASLCLGPINRTLGVASRTIGRLDEAVAHFEQAVVDGRRLGNRPVLAITRGDLALTLLQRGAAGDLDRAVVLATQACAALRSMGLVRRAAAIEGQLATQSLVQDSGALDDAEVVAVTPRDCRVQYLADSTWEITGFGERAVIRNTHGMDYLAKLLAAPCRDIAADELAGVAVLGARHDVLDDRTRFAYRRRIETLRSELDAADEAGDEYRSAAAQDELDRLVAELSAHTGIGGRSRAFADSRERARTSVQKALRRTVERITVQAPSLGAALSEGIRTGLHCRFEPSPEPSLWVVSADRYPGDGTPVDPAATDRSYG